MDVSLWNQRTWGILVTAATVVFHVAPATAWVSVVSGTTAIMNGTTGDDTLRIGVEGAWMSHGLFTAGEPGYVSNIDFDSILAGEQRIPDNGTGVIILDAISGDDRLVVTDGFIINPNNHLQVTESTIFLGGEPGGNRPVIGYANFDRVNVNPQNGINGVVEFFSTRAGTTYTFDNLADRVINIGDPASRSLDSIQGPIRFAPGNKAFISLNDFDDTTDNVYTLDTFDTLSRTGSADIELFGAKDIQLYAGDGHNTYIIRQNNLENFNISPGTAGDDAVFGSPQGRLDSIGFPVSFGSGLSTVTYNDSNSPSGASYVLTQGLFSKDHVSISQLFASHTTLNTGPANDVITFSGNFDTEINASASDGDVLVYNMDLSPGQTVAINGEAASITGTNIFGALDFTGIDHLVVNGSAGVDNVQLSPSSLFDISVDGGGPTVAPGDTIALDAGGNKFKLTAGTFTVQGLKPVSFSGFENLQAPSAPPGVDVTGHWTSGTVVTRSNGRQSVAGSFSEENIGVNAALRSKTRFYLSADTELDATDIRLKTQKVKSLAAGEQRVITFTKNLPPTVNPVGMYLVARVDDQNQLFDVNPDNNVLVYGPLF